MRPSNSLSEKSREIKGDVNVKGGNLMASMKCYNDVNVINIIAAISWPPPLFHNFFHPGFLKAASFYTDWLFSHG